MGNRLTRRDLLKAAGTVPILKSDRLRPPLHQEKNAGDDSAVPFILVKDGRSSHAIHIPGRPAAPVAFAAEEIRKYVERISGALLEIRTIPVDSGPATLTIGPAKIPSPPGKIPSNPETDAFQLKVSHEGVAIVGSNPRSTLYGAYELLERVGCKWFLPGEEGEFVPQMATITLPKVDLFSQAAFSMRGMTEDSSATGEDPFWRSRAVEDAAMFLDWMTKNRLNNYRTMARKNLEEEFERRGMAPIQGGGHSVPGMLPEELFESRPELFRMDQSGKRVPDGNVCISNPETVRLCAEVVMKWFRDHPQSEYFTVMGQDIWGGAWCSCDQCKTYSASEQNAILINGIQSILRTAGIKGRCAYAAYRDTLRYKFERVHLDPEVIVGYAPRERSYGHGLADSSSERNRWYRDNLEKWRRQHQGPLVVVDYYHDCILFYSFAVPTIRVIRDDMRAYQKLNITGVGSYMMGRFSWHAYGPSFYVFGRLSWNPDLDVEHELDQLAHLHYGPAAEPIRGFWRELEAGMSRFAAFGEMETLPITTDPFIEQLMADFNTAIEHLDRAEKHAQRALAAATAPPYATRVDLEHRIYRISRAAAEALRHQLNGNYWTAIVERDSNINDLLRRAGRPARPVRGVGYALERLGAARDCWLEHSELLRELDPEPGSYWVRGPRGGPNGLNRAVIGLIELQMDRVRAMARGKSIPK